MTTTPDDIIPPVSLVPPPETAAAKLERDIAAGKGLLTVELPSAVVAAGRRHTFSFYLAHDSFIRNVRWVPGFKLEMFDIGMGAAMKRFGDGTVRVEGRGYSEHRVLVKTLLSFQVLNDTAEDRTFSGEITMEISPVIADRELVNGMPDLATDDTIPGLAPGVTGGAAT